MLLDYICVQILYSMSYHIPLSNQPQDEHVFFFFFFDTQLAPYFKRKVFF